MSTNSPGPKILYADATHAWEDFRVLVHSLIITGSIRRIAEIGAGANPLLSPGFINDNSIDYILYDESETELNKAGDGYRHQVIDFQQPVYLPEPADLVIIQMTLEHIREPAIFFANIHQLLAPGGQACLFFACPTNLPMFANKLLPESISHRLLLAFQPFRSNEKHGKFRAYYRWCFGPTSANIRRLQGAGFSISEYAGYFGHTYYRKFPFLHKLEMKKTAWLLRHPTPHLCTYAQVTLCRP